MGFEEKFMYWISKGMKNRKLNLSRNQNVAQLKLVYGVPKGDVLSPMLFNSYTSEIHKVEIVKDKDLAHSNLHKLEKTSETSTVLIR